ncbi:hypothetical protein SAMN05428965_1538 [Geodermatophilus sp. DSM 45219]|nr:hypothetical protein SAMN05428965_1538 [Geodermatophilus sp. DSM 45219]
MLATAVLGLSAATLGLLPWPPPVWSQSSLWLVADVPGALWVFLLVGAVVSIATAVALTWREADLGPRDLLAWAWSALVVLAAAALLWNALYAAALSTIDFGAPIPIFHWLFTFIPAVLAGSLFRHRGRRARWTAALGTGVVTVPLFALSWSLLIPGLSLAGVANTLWATGILGVAPLAVGVAAAGAMGGGAADSARVS